MVTAEAIRAVRAIVLRPIPEIKAALERTGGDVQAAVDSLVTPEERVALRKAAMFSNVRPAQLDDPPHVIRPAPVETDLAGVLAEVAARAKGHLFGSPVVAPGPLAAFYAHVPGFDDGSTRLWSYAGSDRRLGEQYADIDDAWLFGEIADVGYLFTRLDEPGLPIYVANVEEGTTQQIARDLPSFLRDWLDCDLDMLELLWQVRHRE